jgi:hypothetical protein
MDNNKKKLEDIFEDDPFGLLELKTNSSPIRSEDERLVASFNEVIDFYKTNNREPKLGGSVAESKLYYRLKGIRENEDKVNVLKDHDTCNLLNNIVEKEINSINDILSNDSLGILESDAESIFELKHVQKETTMPEYVARRKPCKDFKNYEHLLKQCQKDLKLGKRELRPFTNEQQIEKGYFFVLKGVLLYIAEVGERKKEKGKVNARLRCIFENGTESDMLLRSLSAELYKHGRRVTEHNEKLLNNFDDISVEDKQTGFIYVLKSKSENREIKAIENLYKIGYSKVTVVERIKNAEKEPTYLMAPVSIVKAYECYNINPRNLENILHAFFGRSCLNVDVFNEKGKRHTPREWFIAPFEVIEEAIHLFLAKEIENYNYDPDKQIIIRN